MADPVADLSSLENLPDKCNQPRRFSFPQREFGKQSKVKRSFQPSWFDRWTWLHYRADSDSVVCFTCLKAHSLKRLQWSSNADQAFLAKGFCNLKNACVKFDSHQASRCHKEAVLKMVSLPATTQDVEESLSSQHQSEKLERRLCFIKVMSSIRFLLRQGLSLRGHGEEVDSNFSQLLKLRAEEDPRIQTWMKKKTNKYTSSDVQNEVLKTMSHHILRKVASSVRLAPFCAIMVDETTDVANKEQVVLCLRWVDSCLAAHEEFMGLYQVDSTEASVLNQVIHDFLTRLNMSINKVRGQCYDGAAAMSGSRTGVATRILKEEPRAVFTHCYGHALNLACSDMVKKCRLMKDALDVVYEITKLIKFSPRRDAKLQRLKQQVAMESPGIRVLCPTRWTVRGQALQSIIANYDMLQLLWEESLTFVRETDIKSRIMGVSTYMKSFDFFFGVLLGEVLLLHSDNLSKSLQSSTMSAAEGQKVAAMTIKALQSMRNEEHFDLFWTKALKMASDLKVHDPVLPRKRKAPIRYEIGEGAGDFIDDVKVHYRHIFYLALDLIINGIQSRFDQPGYQVYCRLEEVLVKAARRENYEEALQFISNLYQQDFNKDLLETQLGIMATDLPERPEAYDLQSVINYLKDISPGQRTLLSEVCTIASLVLVLPATNAVSERSFSSLRRLKSYLRSTMTQERLNSLMTLHVHKELTDQLDLLEIGNEFVGFSEHRLTMFGKLCSTDSDKTS